MTEFLIDILARARTFHSRQWRYQAQPSFCPYQFASIGYSLVKQDTIECCICHHQVHFYPELDETPHNLNQIQLHKQNCLYLGEKAKIITKEQLYLRMDELISDMLKQSKKHPISKFPLLNMTKAWSVMNSDKFTLNKVLQSYSINPNKVKISFFLELFGWYVDAEPAKETLNCYFCGRKVPMHELKLTDKDIQECSQNKDEQSYFDLTEQHRYYCIWTGNTNGMLIYLQHLYDKIIEMSALKLKTGTAETKKVRVQIDRYMDTFQNKANDIFGQIQGLLKQCEKINESISTDPNIHSLELEEQTKIDFKRLRQHSSEMEAFSNQLSLELKTSLKKIRIQ